MSAAWLDNDIQPMRATIARKALDYVGIFEMPLGSNRSQLIDSWLRCCGTDPGQPWCAAFANFIYTSAEARTPPAAAAAVSTWRSWAMVTGLWKPVPVTPTVGDLAVFDFAGTGKGDHCGIVVRVDPIICTVEGNTDDLGGREGIGVYLHTRQGHGLIGYVTAETQI